MQPPSGRTDGSLGPRTPNWDRRLSPQQRKDGDNRQMKRLRDAFSRRWGSRPAIVLLCVALVAGCGGGGGGGSAADRRRWRTRRHPPVPQGVTASATSATRIRVTWQASTDAGTGVAGYRVFRNGGATAVATADRHHVHRRAASRRRPSTRTRCAPMTPRNRPTSRRCPRGGGHHAGVPHDGARQRPDNTTCVAGARPSQVVTLATERVFPNLPSFSSPILMLQAPGDATRWFVVEQGGTVRVFDNQPAVDPAAASSTSSSRVRSGGEQGLLGMAFHPGFPTDPRVYLSYTNCDAVAWCRGSPSFGTRDGGSTLDPASEVILLTVAQPESNHNGGNIAFGPDGFLYIGFGDGGGGGDQHGSIGNGQNLQTTLGKLLRIDVDGSTGGVPLPHPRGQPVRRQRALQRRRPVRRTARRSTPTDCATRGAGASIVAAASCGWRTWDRARWRKWTASSPAAITAGAASRARDRTTPPAARMRRAACRPSRSTTTRSARRSPAGTSTAARAIPALAGRYVFGDYVSGRIWHIAGDTSPTLTVTTGFDSGLSIAAFAEGSDGELYIVHYGGTLHRLRPGSSGGGTVPNQLSATGCVDPANATRPASGLVPYAPNAPFWSDGATKDRYLALPNGTTLTVDRGRGHRLSERHRADEAVPPRRSTGGDAALHAAHRRRVGRLQLRMECAGNGRDARGRRQGHSRSASQTWMFPSEAQCLSCHTAAAGRSLGLEIAQLNGPLLYPQTGRTANQIATLDAIGMFSPAIGTPPDQLPALPDPLRILRDTRRTGARLPAHQLFAVPPPERRHARGPRPALHDRALRHQHL